LNFELNDISSHPYVTIIAHTGCGVKFYFPFKTLVYSINIQFFSFTFLYVPKT
jgi:hypothetical protein